MGRSDGISAVKIRPDNSEALMAANIKFNVKVLLTNPGMLPELQSRMADLEPAFRAIYGEWVDINEQKFGLSKGAEVIGADIFGEEWAALTPDYIKEKHPGGAPKRRSRKVNDAGYREYPDWLMVRTGALMEAMTNPDALFQMFDAQQAVFGTPNDPDLADIVMWQAGPRQKERFVVFLSDPDINAIKRNLQDYFSMGGDFQEMRSEAGMQAVQMEKEIESMDAGFDFATGGSE